MFVGCNKKSGERRPDDTRQLFPGHRSSSSAASAGTSSRCKSQVNQSGAQKQACFSRKNGRMRGLLVPPWITFLFVAHVQPGAAESKNERSYNGSGNNVDNPLWGSANHTQIRRVAADYSDGVSAVNGADRPSARDLTAELFTKVPVARNPKSALFVAWGQLVSFDLFRNTDNLSEPFNVSCETSDGVREEIDVWCPLGSNSDPIPFYRSDAEVVSGTRQPLNRATSYLDLDFVYGRSKAEAESLRELQGGFMKLDEDGLPERTENGAWLIADERTAQFPVTFALHVMFLMEHNRCCKEDAPDWGLEEDEAIFQACRAQTIVFYQHVTQNDFSIRLLGMDVVSEFGSETSSSSTSSSSEPLGRGESRGTSSTTNASDLDWPDHVGCSGSVYNAIVDAGTDVFFSTVGAAAFHAAIPPTVRIMNEGYHPALEDGIELVEAVESLGWLFQKNGTARIIRGAALSPSLTIDAHFSSSVSTVSRLFKLPVDDIQRGRDHGIPSYNDAREAYGLRRANSFDNVTHLGNVRRRLEKIYDGNISRMDALTGALAEGDERSPNFVFGDLLKKVWSDQIYRSIVGDCFWNVSLATKKKDMTLKQLVSQALNVTDLSDAPFVIPEITVCYEGCTATKSFDVALSSEFSLGWEIRDEETIAFTLSAKYMGDECYMAIGFGGTTMIEADDYLVCIFYSETSHACTDRAPVSSRKKPSKDNRGWNLTVVNEESTDDLTSITFLREKSDLDEQDYDIFKDIGDGVTTQVIYAYSQGDFGLHPNANRGAATVDFSNGTASTICEDDPDFFLLHGGLILIAWMFFATFGIYYARYCKGEMVSWGSQWWQRHAELMTVASELVLPLSITAIFSTQDSLATSHAKWGIYMIVGIAFQLVTGWLRAKALEGRHRNFSRFHRLNKHVHIWCGQFAYLAGIVECYRGLELVSSADSVIVTTYDIDFELGSFGVMYEYVFPAWAGLVFTVFLILEARKQRKRYKNKGAVKLFGICVLFNKEFVPEGQGGEGERRMMARNRALPVYCMEEFNYKVLNGESWVIVDGAILDVSTFYGRHPGGSRVIMNSVGTDVTCDLVGEDRSIGNAVSYSPHAHSQEAWEIARSLMVGYIDEETCQENNESGSGQSDDDDDYHNDLEPEHDRAAVSDSSETKQQRTSRGVNVFGAVPGQDDIYCDDPQRAEAASSTGDAGRRSGRKSASFSVGSGSRRALFASSGRRRPPPASMKTMKSITSAFSSNTRGAIRAEAIARTWAEKERRRHVTGAYTESPALVLQTSMTLVPGFPQREVEVGKFVLERYHVCPFVLRERLDGDNDSSRPIYRYVFSCPGEAAALAKAISGVCHLNMRIMRRDRQTLVQRSYNAFAVSLVEVPIPLGSLDKSRSRPWPITPPLRRDTDHGMVWAAKSSEETPPLPTLEEYDQEENDLEKYYAKRLAREGRGRLRGSSSRPDDKEKLAPRSTIGTTGLGGSLRRAFFMKSIRRGAGVPDFGDIFEYGASSTTAASPKANKGTGLSLHTGTNQKSLVGKGTGSGRGGRNGGGNERTVLKAVPADESSHGDLGVEIRIRLYPDGAMSKLLEEVASDPENATVQLQGPFPVEDVAPPPAYPNLVMIAAGTGINPMVQLIRDYQDFESADAFANPSTASMVGALAGSGGRRSRMSLIWQVAKPSDLFCLEEIGNLEVKSKGRLKVTTILTCDDGRRLNNPAGPKSFLRSRTQRSPPPAPRNASEVKSHDVENPDGGSEPQGAAPATTPILDAAVATLAASSGEMIITSPSRGFSRELSIPAKEAAGVFSFGAQLFSAKSPVSATPASWGGRNASGSVKSAEETTAAWSLSLTHPDIGERQGVPMAAQERRLAQGRRRKYFATGDIGASDGVVVSPGGSVTGTEWDNHSESRSSADSAAFEQRSDRLSGIVVGDGRKGLHRPRPFEGRSSFFQQTNQGDRAVVSSRSASRQEWRQTQPSTTVGISKLPNDSRPLRPRDSGGEEKKEAAERSSRIGPNVLPSEPVATLKRGARSTGNLVAENALESWELNSRRKPSIGKITKAQLRDALGEDLVRELSERKRPHQRRTSASSRRKRVHKGGGGDFDDVISRENEPVPLLGHSCVADQLQVVVSGPSGFVFKVEAMLDEIGVPPGAIVVLD